LGSIRELDLGHRTQLDCTSIEPRMLRNSEVMEMQVEQGKRFSAPDRTAVIVVGVVLALLLIGLLGGGMMVGPGMMVAGPLLVVAVVLLVVWLVGGRRLPGTDAAAGGDGAQNILRERYARGELTHEQYEQMRRDLG
jgi:putative membrane protein